VKKEGLENHKPYNRVNQMTYQFHGIVLSLLIHIVCLSLLMHAYLLPKPENRAVNIQIMIVSEDFNNIEPVNQADKLPQLKPLKKGQPKPRSAEAVKAVMAVPLMEKPDRLHNPDTAGETSGPDKKTHVVKPLLMQPDDTEQKNDDRGAYLVHEAEGSAEGEDHERYEDEQSAEKHNLSIIKDKISARYVRENFNYINQIINKNISYPLIARKMSLEGRVIVSFVINTDGSVRDIKIEKGSAVSILDRNALETIKKCIPFPSPPVETEIVIPVNYKLY